MEEAKALPVKKIDGATFVYKHTIVTRIMHGAAFDIHDHAYFNRVLYLFSDSI